MTIFNKMQLFTGMVVGKIQIFANNSWLQELPYEREWKAVATSGGNSLLEPFLPVQAKLFPMTTEYEFTTLTDNSQSNKLFTSFGVVADKRIPQTLVEKVVLVC